MKPNQIKIVSNNKGKKLSYFFQNEKSEWNLVSNTSAPLPEKICFCIYQ